jgi:4-amino-4-deoxy-L-arabinose transferase-like glycosyltransferase
MFKILTPGMFIVLLGFFGLIAILTESPAQIRSKIPLAFFFIFIMVVGIWIEIKMGEPEEEYGEFGGGRRGYG